MGGGPLVLMHRLLRDTCRPGGVPILGQTVQNKGTQAGRSVGEGIRGGAADLQGAGALGGFRVWGLGFSV